MYRQMRELIAEHCHRMWLLGWGAANDGNISVKTEDGILATGTGISKYDMTADDIGLTDGCGNILWKPREDWRPSSEIKLHLMCYAEREDAGAVVHAHPPFSTAFACAHRTIDTGIMIESVLELGEVPTAPYAPPSTDSLPDSVRPFIREHNAVLLANHGALTAGIDLKAAFFRMETLEHTAKTAVYAGLIGGAVPLPDEEYSRLIRMRAGYGLDRR